MLNSSFMRTIDYYNRLVEEWANTQNLTAAPIIRAKEAAALQIKISPSTNRNPENKKGTRALNLKGKPQSPLYNPKI